MRRGGLGAWPVLCGAVLLGAASAAAQTAAPLEPPPLPSDPVLEAPQSESDDLLEEAVGPAPGAATMGLAEAVAQALEGNFALLAAADSLSSARYQYSAALAQFYPKLTPRYERHSSDDSTMAVDASQQLPWTGGSLIGSARFRSDPDADGPVSRSSNLSLTLTQPLLRGFGPNASLFDLRNSRRDRQGRERLLERERQRLAVEVADAFYQVLERRALLAVSRQSLQRTRSLQRASEARLAVGLVSKLDVYRAQVQAAQAEESAVRAETGLQDALERFRFLLGIHPAEPVEPAAMALSTSLPPPPADPLPVLVERALATRLDLQEARDQVDDARRGASLARQNLLPQLDLNLGVTREGFGTSFSSAWNAGDKRVNLFFTASFPVERSTELTARALTELALTGVRRTLRQRELEIESQVRSALREIEQVRKSVDLQKQAVEVARQQLRLATLRYQRGLASNFDVVDAESSLVLARSALVSLVARYHIARLELLRATGELDVEKEFR